jgi:AcrR family transcriptional regulator
MQSVVSKKPDVPQTAPASLRSRKKQRTRQQIADAAAALFAANGFERVTVADVARAADVSEQTVYNYFPAKEQLVLDEDEAFEARFVAMIRDRPKGASFIDAVRTEARCFLDELSRRQASPHRTGGMPYLIATSPSMRRHWLAVSERHANAMAGAIVAEGGGAIALPAAKILGLSLVAVFAVIVDEVGQAMKNDADLTKTLAALQVHVDYALDQLAEGLNASVRRVP